MQEFQSDCRANARRIISTVLLCGFAFCGASANEAPAQPAVRRIMARSQALEVCDRSFLELEFPDWLTIVRSHDPAVVHVAAIRPNRLRVECLNSGMAILHAVDRSDHEYTIELNVRARADREE